MVRNRVRIPEIFNKGSSMIENLYVTKDSFMTDVINLTEHHFVEKHGMFKDGYRFAKLLVTEFNLRHMWERDILCEAYEDLCRANGVEFGARYLRELWVEKVHVECGDYALVEIPVRHISHKYVVNVSLGFIRRVE